MPSNANDIVGVPPHDVRLARWDHGQQGGGPRPLHPTSCVMPEHLAAANRQLMPHNRPSPAACPASEAGIGMTEQDEAEQRVSELGVAGGWRRRQLTRLYCMNGGYHLQISADGTVLGQRGDTEDVHSKTHCSGTAQFFLFYGQAKDNINNMMRLRSSPTSAGVSQSRTTEWGLKSSLGWNPFGKAIHLFDISWRGITEKKTLPSRVKWAKNM